MKRVLVVALLVLLSISALAFAQEKVIHITFWHAFGGGRMHLIERMVEDFNYTHPGIEVTAEYKGSYRDTLNAAILAAQQGNALTSCRSSRLGPSWESIPGSLFRFRICAKAMRSSPTT